VIVLALDTTSRAGSCAVLAGAAGSEGAHVQPGDGSRSHDARLPGELMALLEQARLTLADVDLFAVATGPGSFTGLRVGIATMQGLAFACGRPLIGVSALEALAAQATADAAPGQSQRVAVWVDAWRGDVYSALYERGRVVDEVLVESPQAALRRLPGGPMWFIGDGAAVHADTIRAARPDARIADPAAPALAGTIGRLALAAAGAGHHPPPDAIRPLYVRRAYVDPGSDARA
jgi:tRNA threonylcarbamoyladenosine biosynthesis protein TsaB